MMMIIIRKKNTAKSVEQNVEGDDDDDIDYCDCYCTKDDDDE